MAVVLCIVAILEQGCRHIPLGTPLKGADESMVLTKEWTAGGRWDGADYDPASGEIFGLMNVFAGPDHWNAKVSRLSADGTRLGATEIAGDAGWPRRFSIARLIDGAPPGFVTSGHPGDCVFAFDSKGRPLWELRPLHLLDVVVADLDGDGRDEILVCTLDGLAVHNADGTLRWKTEQSILVFHAVVLPANAERSLRIAVPQLRRNIAFLDSSGATRATFEQPYGENLLSTMHNDSGAALVMNISRDPLTLAAVDLTGKQLWRITDADTGRNYATDTAPAPDRPWFALILRDGTLLVHDTNDGRRLASATGFWHGRLVWVPGSGDKPPLLVVFTQSGANAFTLRAHPTAHGAPESVLGEKRSPAASGAAVP